MARFRIEDKSPIRDALFTGMQQPTAFDQYVKASLDDFNVSGPFPFSSRLQSMVDRAAPNYSTFFVHTHKMFATFSWFPEGEDSHLWGETVTKLANSVGVYPSRRRFFSLSLILDFGNSSGSPRRPPGRVPSLRRGRRP